MKHVSLFTGIGGFELAAERAGMENIAMCEFDGPASRVLTHHWPTVSLWGDVATLDGHELEADILTAGSPCQDFSIAGLRAGLAGERSGLFDHVIRLRDEIGPRFVVWENVPGALTSNKGADFANVIGALVGSDEPIFLPKHPNGRRSRYAGVAYGPVGTLAWRVLDAQHFGVPQRRQRIFAVLDTQGDASFHALFPGAKESDLHHGQVVEQGRTKVVLLDVDGVPFDTGMQPPDPVQVKLAQVLEGEVDERYFLSEKACKGILKRAGRRGRKLPEMLDYALRCQAGEFAEVPEEDDDGRFEKGQPVPFDWQASGSGDESFRGKSRAYVVRKGDTSGTMQSNKVEAVAVPATNDVVCATGDITHALTRASSKGATEDGTGRGQPIVPVASTLQGGGQRGYRIGAEDAAGGHLVPTAFRSPEFGVHVEDDVSSPLLARDAKGRGDLVVAADDNQAQAGHLVPALMKQREGKPGGGKGPLLFEDRSGTLATGNDQILFDPRVICGPEDRSSLAPRDTSPTLTAGQYKDPISPVELHTFAKVHRAHHKDDPETWAERDVTNTLNLHDTGDKRATDVIVESVSYAVKTNQTGSNGGNVAQDRSFTLSADEQPSAVAYAIEPAYGLHGTQEAIYLEGRALPLESNNGAHSSVVGHSVTVSPYYRVRRLTPTECERLQGFPDGHTAVEGAKDSNRYRQLGNAVAVPVAEWVLRRVAEAAKPRKKYVVRRTPRT